MSTCAVSGKCNVSRAIPRLYVWVCKTLRLSPLVVEHSVVVMTVGCQSRRSKIESYRQPIFDFPFMKLVLQSLGPWTFVILVEDFDTGGPSSVTVRIEYLFAFQSWYCDFCVENRRWGGRKFSSLRYLSIQSILVEPFF